MASLRSRVEAWIREQTAKMGALTWSPPLTLQVPVRWRWPPWWRDGGKKEQEKRLREEYELRRRQLQDLCGAVKAESIADLQEVICSMVLSECVYKVSPVPSALLSPTLRICPRITHLPAYCLSSYLLHILLFLRRKSRFFNHRTTYQ